MLPVRICSFVALAPAGAHAMRIPIIAAKLYLLVCCLYCAGFGESPGLHVVCSLCAFRHPDIPATSSVPDAEGTLGFRSHFRYLSIFIEEKSLTFAERWASNALLVGFRVAALVYCCGSLSCVCVFMIGVVCMRQL